MEFTVRAARPLDAPAMADLIVAAFASQEMPTDPPPSALRETPQTVSGHLRNGGGLVAAAGGALVGVLIWTPQDRALTLSRLSVATDWRRRGVALALLHAAEERARTGAFERMTLGTRLVLAGNRALFAAAGFRETSIETHAGYAAPTWVAMERRLDP